MMLIGTHYLPKLKKNMDHNITRNNPIFVICTLDISTWKSPLKSPLIRFLVMFAIEQQTNDQTWWKIISVDGN